MTREDLLQEFPTRRLKPFDGLAVTAAVWEEAHDYHRQQLRLHALLNHGPGVVTGLEVIASDPPDRSVYILPGIAADPEGHTIVLTQPVAYDFGQDMEGLLYLLSSYGETGPTTDNGKDQDGERLYLRLDFAIHARPTLPDTPYVELARVQRQGKESPIQDAQDAAHPGPNELDQRFRQEIGATPQEIASLAVSYLGGKADHRHGLGANRLARALSCTGNLRAWVDDDVPLASGLERYTLVYLVGQGAFQLSKDEMDALYAYLQAGGTLFIESCRHETTKGKPPADASFADLLSTLGLKLEDLPPDHSLLDEPSFFAAPPPGFETNGKSSLQVTDGVIFSTYDYGCLWQGERRGGTPSREDIRSALEWGHNIVTYALQRRKR
jgi:hypothetical protein